MSRKPTIKISYPDASEKALQLTEAMVKRAPGKRVVETESEDPIFPDDGELFSGFIHCKTQTGVELTLTLNSSSMDYALETLIRPNLTADERKRILGDSASGDDLLSPAQSAEAGTQSEFEKLIIEAMHDHFSEIEEEVDDGKPSFAEDLARRMRLHLKMNGTQSGEQEKQIEIGKISDKELRTILVDLVDATQGYIQGEKHVENAIETAIKEIDHRAGVIEEENPVLIQEDTVLLDMLSVLICGSIRVNNKRITELKTYASNVAHYLNDAHPDDKNVFVVAARDLADALFSVQHDFTEDANRTLDAETLVRKNKRIDEARSASRADEDKSDETNETDDIEPGLLDDLDDESKQDGDEAWMSHKCGDCRNFNGKNKCKNSGATVDKSCICGQWHDFGICETCAHFEHDKKKCQEVDGKPTLAMQSICPLHIDDHGIKYGSKTEADHG